MFIKKLNVIVVIFSLFIAQNSVADHSQVYGDEEIETLKALKDAGKIMSLEKILAELASHDISRILEIELKSETHDKSSDDNIHRYIYEIEYINEKGVVVEIEVDALTSQVIDTDEEH
ncbi:PepSY domain-containing protein [sulfur-oxidizing endosymbiont of Gigantopelta aegis]|uniref:PepSY domain-containing protein n=1 Tax=sulfur-oxidizing endosymbiont of Gigantopelta aegis TaxID=2794934 RepID=UPI0018DBFC0B|nr:hypothetical protein [sulfur-oxidizing endosymbiont of Gigantopelta aegis]